MRRMADTEPHQTSLRIPHALLVRIDALAEQVRAADPYAKVTRSDALFRALRMGLDAAGIPEAPAERPAKRKRNR